MRFQPWIQSSVTRVLGAVGQCGAMSMGPCAPGRATHCAPYPQLWPCDPGQILCLTGPQTFQCTDATFQALQSWCSNQAEGRGKPSVGQASNFLGRILKE